MAKENVYLASKPRYEILDGLRGVAALMVVVFHCFETYVPVFKTQIVNHGYLAVDFFFMAIILAWGLLKVYDLPVRQWLTEHWLKRPLSQVSLFFLK